MNAQEICDKYTNDLFAYKYFGETPQTMVEFEKRIRFENVIADRHENISDFRRMVLNKVETSWAKHNRPLSWDDELEVKEAIEQFMEIK